MFKTLLGDHLQKHQVFMVGSGFPSGWSDFLRRQNPGSLDPPPLLSNRDPATFVFKTPLCHCRPLTPSTLFLNKTTGGQLKLNCNSYDVLTTSPSTPTHMWARKQDGKANNFLQNLILTLNNSRPWFYLPVICLLLLVLLFKLKQNDELRQTFSQLGDM